MLVQILRVLTAGILLSASCGAQPGGGRYIISTIAGWQPPENATAATGVIVDPAGIATDGNSNIYFYDRAAFIIRKVTPAGRISTIAGSGRLGYTGDEGPATAAQIAPYGQRFGQIASDPQGNVYFLAQLADRSFRVRKVDISGVIHTIPAGGGSLTAPSGLAADGSGNVFIADVMAHKVYKIAPGGGFSTIAGTGSAGFSGDHGRATSAQLGGPQSLAVDGAGNLFIGDAGENCQGGGFIFGSPCLPANIRVRKVDPAGVITTVTGSDQLGYTGDGGPAIQASIEFPDALAADEGGNLYIAQITSVRKITAAGIISTVVRNIGVSGLATDRAGKLYLPDSNRKLIYKLDGAALITFAGLGIPGRVGNGGPATRAPLGSPFSLARDRAGAIYFGDGGVVRKVSRSGIISTVAGGGNLIDSSGGDGGLATSAVLFATTGLAVDDAGNLYIAGSNSGAIRKVSPGGIISSVAKTDTLRGDSWEPYGLAADPAGNVYAADRQYNRVRKLSPDGSLAIIAGTHPASPNRDSGGYSGDYGPAIEAKLAFPYDVAVDADGNVYIADTNNHAVRKIDSAGIITTVAGNGKPGFAGDGGPATKAQLQDPSGVAAGPDGTVYIADTSNNRVRAVTPDGVIATIAGEGGGNGIGDGGPAISAQLSRPVGIVASDEGTLYFVDSGNRRVRKLALQSGTLPALTAASLVNSASFASGPIAPLELVSILEANTGVTTELAHELTSQFTLSGASVLFRDGEGEEQAAHLVSVGPERITLVAPAGLRVGSTTMILTIPDGRTAALGAQVDNTAPGLFTATGDGQGLAVGQAVRTTEEGTQIVQALFACNGPKDCRPVPVDFGQSSDRVSLTLYGTGLRNRSSLSAVQVRLGEDIAAIVSAGAEPGSPGVDQINVELPQTWRGRGEVIVSVSVDGKPANAVSVHLGTRGTELIGSP